MNSQQLAILTSSERVFLANKVLHTLMIFFTNRKILKDRRAGLIFQWRGSDNNNTTGKIISLLITTSIVLALFFGFSIESDHFTPQKKANTKIQILTDLDKNVYWWAEKHSPTIFIWDDIVIGHQRAGHKMASHFNEQLHYTPQWKSLPPHEASPSLINVTASSNLAPLDIHSIQLPKKTPNIPVQPNITFALSSKDKHITKRLPQQLSQAPNFTDNSTWLDHQVRFSLILNQDGKVIQCSPLNWDQENEINDITQWLRCQKFTPADSLSSGTLTLTIQSPPTQHNAN